MWCARCRSVASVSAATARSHGRTASGSGVLQHETLSAASGSRVTTSRTATPAHIHGWNPRHQCSGPRTRTGRRLSRAVPKPLVPLARSDQVDQVARLLSSARESTRGLLPQDARTRPSPSVTATSPSRPSTSRAAQAARPPSSANTTSCSMECAVPSVAAGARSRCGSTSYSSRHRYHDTRISGRTPRTVSAPAANRSRAAAIRPRFSSDSAAPFVAGAVPVAGSFAPFIQFPLGVGGGTSQYRFAVACQRG